MIKEILYLLILIAGIPAGLMLGKLCKEEIKNWRRIFWIISGVCFILSIFIWLFNFEYKIPVALSFLFIIIVDCTVIWASHKKI